MPEILTYSFMQRAFIAGIMVALICPSIGIFIVLRRLSMIGDTLSHVALAGVAAGMLGGFYPVYSALIFSVLAALGIEKLRKAYKDYAELSIAIVLSAGIGVATILISLGSGNAAIFGYLFGSIALVSEGDILLVVFLSLFILASILFLYRGLFYITFDEETAALSGVPVKGLNLYFIILIAVTIAVSMRIVGILLVSSLMIVPVATSLQIAKSFKSAWLYSLVFGLIAVLTGLTTSFYADLAPGGTIVVSSIGILLVVVTLKSFKQSFTIAKSTKSAKVESLEK
ncbi:zinc transport system permease protein [Natronincola peptidivorans]|uniref:Zinc transport system permease protein n=1 Tax=Natronincola peptidivorans TaxID=426128 RepID=A0A1I0DA42_9FIRM|nr:metal ABC transporter permease [Natronincola peptidivorans]SET28542.1 zinc transport system permease protein [Natronincola peptidivorans]